MKWVILFWYCESESGYAYLGEWCSSAGWLLRISDKVLAVSVFYTPWRLTSDGRQTSEVWSFVITHCILKVKSLATFNRNKYMSICHKVRFIENCKYTEITLVFTSNFKIANDAICLISWISSYCLLLWFRSLSLRIEIETPQQNSFLVVALCMIYYIRKIQ